MEDSTKSVISEVDGDVPPIFTSQDIPDAKLPPHSEKVSEYSVDQRLLESDFKIQEYGTIVQKMMGDVSWSASFVALYFGFLVSLVGGLGFLFFASEMRSLPKGSESASLREASIYLLVAFGGFLNVWAIFMVVDYKRTTRVNLTRLAEIERDFLSLGSGYGVAHRTLTMNSRPYWRYGTFVVVGAVLLMFFAPWALGIIANLSK